MRSGGAESKTVRVTLPDWPALAAAGWTARFVEAQGGTDITSQITSASGWSTVMSDGDEKSISAQLTAPANVTAGALSALTFRVEADPTSETPALDVVKATWTATVATPDLSIRAEGRAWRGEGTFNETGAEQSLQRVIAPGQTVTNQIKLAVADAGAGQMVRWSVPEWDAFRADGWTAIFTDAPSGGNDITAQIIAGDWFTPISAGQQKIIYVEVTSPVQASDVTRELSVRAEVSGAIADVVKTSFQVLSTVRPDVSISRLNGLGSEGDWVGIDQISPAEQKIGVVWGEGQTQSFVLRIKNTSNETASFNLSVPPVPVGWQVRFYDAPAGGAWLQDEIATPPIAAGQSVTWRLDVTANGSALQASLPIRLSAKHLFDEVEIDVALQRLVGLKWSRDGESWTNVTAATKLQSLRYGTIAFKAIKALPHIAWPDEVMGPKWEWQGVTLVGETVWLSPQRVTDGNGESARATLGGSFGVRVVALPDVELYLDAASGVMSAGATVALTIKTRDENNAPLANLRVRLRSTRDGANNGHFGAEPSGEVFLVTDAQGNINTTWTADAAGRTEISVEAVDGADAVFGDGDSWTMEVTN